MPEDFFGYQEVDEEPEQLDFEHLIKCPHCGKFIPQDSLTCYYCGNKVTRAFPKWLILTSLIIIILFLVLIIF